MLLAVKVRLIFVLGLIPEVVLGVVLVDLVNDDQGQLLTVLDSDLTT